MNILLTGGAGYIGSHTSLCLIEKGHAVTVVDNLVNGNVNLVPKKANFLIQIFLTKIKLKIYLKKNKFDLVMHFAVLVKVGNLKKILKNIISTILKKQKHFLIIV